MLVPVVVRMPAEPTAVRKLLPTVSASSAPTLMVQTRRSGDGDRTAAPDIDRLQQGCELSLERCDPPREGFDFRRRHERIPLLLGASIASRRPSRVTARPALLWFRDDLRLSDNPAPRAAIDHGPPICLYLLDDSKDRRPLGGAARWWLSRSLSALSEAITAKGGELLILRGDPAELLPRIAREADIGYVAWNRRYDAAAIELDKSLKATLTDRGIEVESFNANLLNEPWQVTTKADGPFKVFTPYWRAVREGGEPAAPFPTPRELSKARLPATLRKQALA
eukprot:gene28892-37266_t